MADKIVSALTVDVEDAVNQAMRNYFSTDIKPTERVYTNTMQLLDLFSDFKVSATFFILGEVAAEFPGLIREIAGRGHELGIHGYSHARYFNLSKEKARDEIVRAKQIIEDIAGISVSGHRAPEFSINQNTLWVLEILLDAGIKYDSSIFPAKTFRYGWAGFNKDIGWLTLIDGRKIIEAPLSTVNYFGKEVPACGGGYLRAFPYCFTNYAFRKIIDERPVIVYMHPYEIDPPPFQPFYMDAVRKSSNNNKIQLYAYWYNRKSVIPKLGRLLNSYKFDTLRNVINVTLKTTL
jgi:polysaccharide deacetylase family protein (PEP-CTERM system associated)